MAGFEFKRMDVYSATMEFVSNAYGLARTGRSWPPFMTDQWLRAAVSISLNLAEGAGEYSGPEKARFYRIARRSAHECSAMLDILLAMKLIDAEERGANDELLDRITAMLTNLTRRHEGGRASRPRPRPRPRPEPPHA